MAVWLQIILGALLLTKEVIKYINSIEKNKHERAKSVKRFKDAIRTARTTKDTTHLESAMSDIGFIRNGFND